MSDQQEYEFIMEGITTRMQMAMEKISESNKLLRSTVKYVCWVMLAVVIIVVTGFIVNNKIMIQHINDIRSGAVGGVVSVDETIQQLGSGADDR